ncbi:MAG: histidinol dehydrogenase [Chitinophagaceae bacterium]|nr:MAG: histidinol dehydrogenase [Chitinophagaceae bacterium]
MKIYTYSKLSKYKVDELCSRQIADDPEVEKTVSSIISAVRSEGDAGVKRFDAQFGNGKVAPSVLDEHGIQLIAENIDPTLRSAIDAAAGNIRKFHMSQCTPEPVIETLPGVTCWRKAVAINKVGLYVPGGTAILPSTLLMLGIPATIAGCREIIVCTPPDQEGRVNAAIAYAAISLGITRIHLTGGAQAIAAMAYGTETIPKTDKIFGPGNRYVTAAKTLVQKDVAIDMPAGPSEVLIIADDTAIPSFVAADLLAQAEHGIDSQAILVCTSSNMLNAVEEEINLQLATLPRADIARKALENSFFMLTSSLNEAFEFSNIYAPEHLILALENYEQFVDMIENAGSVFLGNLTPESAGDYASGTNHTLPTGGFAKAYSGVSVDSFVKKITFQRITGAGLQNIGETVEVLAAAEGLEAHKKAITIRKEYNGH